MGKILTVATSLLLLLLLFLSCEVNGKPSPSEDVSDTSTTASFEESDFISSNKTNSLKAHTINTTVTTDGKCYQHCNTTCDNDQCHKICTLMCNDDARDRKQRDTAFTEVMCYHNCSTSCDDGQCYEPCIFKCNSGLENATLTNDRATSVNCYKACQATQNNIRSYKQCLSRCSGILQSDEDFPPTVGSEVRQPIPVLQHPKSPPLPIAPPVLQHPKFPPVPVASPVLQHPKFPPLPVAPPVTPIPLFTLLPSTPTLRDFSPIPVRQRHPSISFTSSIPSTPASPIDSSGSETKNPAVFGALVPQSNNDTNCTTIVIYTCDSNRENCVARDTSYDCVDDTSSTHEPVKPSQPPCPGICRRRSVDGRCLKDVSCCNSVSRSGPQFTTCLLDIY